MNNRTIRLLEYEKIREMLRHYASSSLGKEYVDRIRPVRDTQLVRGRMQETCEARALITERGDPPLGGLRDVREAVTRAEKQAALTAQELLDIADTAACSRRLRRFLQENAQEFKLIRAQAQLLQEFSAIERAVDQAISSSGEVVDSASLELERARRRVRALNEEIQHTLHGIVNGPTVQDQLQEPLITQRNGRFCVPVRAESRNVFKGIVHDLSASGQTVFMEPLAIMELGNDLREAERREEEEVQRVLTGISMLVGAVAKALLDSIETAGRLDLIFARAYFARALDATEPELNTEGIIDLRQARHPLLGQQAVPIDVRLGEEGISSLLITGPNTGGKTVTLKTVGLLTLMAQSGMQIPALPGSRVAMFDEIFVDIGDEQSIEQSLSTFSSHMTNLVRIIKDAGAQSLILLDEIGAGTDPAEGAALGKAILLSLHERGCRTIATTHYGELKIFGQQTEGFINASVEFDIETLRPTYRVMIGLPGSSNALSISQRLGLPKSLIARAKELMGEAPQAMEQVIKQAEGVRRALDRERTAAVRERKEAQELTETLRQEQRAFEEKREVYLGRARQQAQEIVQKARIETNALLEELRTALRATREKSADGVPAMDTGALRKRVRAVIGSLDEQVAALPKPVMARPTIESRPALQSVVAGQAVYVRSLGHRGTALETGAGDAEVEVQVGIMRVRVPVHDLEARNSVTTAPPSLHTAIAPQLEKEIHLLGKRAEEAESALDAYLYDALESGLTYVRIVHGFGTGALRQVVQNLLRHHPAVRSYRPGQPQEGGGGVTIADIGNAE